MAMDKLVFHRDAPIRKRGTTVVRIYSDAYAEADKIAEATGKNMSEIVSRLVLFAIEHTEIIDNEE